MAEITVALISKLRQRTGAGLGNCRKALIESDGDIEAAIDELRKKGIATAAKKAGRATKEGVIAQCIGAGAKSGTLIEINCETDFVARTDDFRHLAHDIAMQVAAMAPIYVDSSEIPEGEDGNPQETCLMQQPYIKDPSLSMRELVDQAVGRLGENLRVGRITRFSLGE